MIIIEIYAYIHTKIGIIKITQDDKFITKIEYQTQNISNHYKISTPLLDRAISQLSDYFNNKRKYFDLPIKPKGTAFQLKVWNELQKIPYGETRTYKQIAENIGSPKAFRAVGNANNKNPIPIIIPCHRVVGSNGNLVGYAGGIHIKNFLLNLESYL